MLSLKWKDTWFVVDWSLYVQQRSNSFHSLFLPLLKSINRGWQWKGKRRKRIPELWRLPQFLSSKRVRLFAATSQQFHKNHFSTHTQWSCEKTNLFHLKEICLFFSADLAVLSPRRLWKMLFWKRFHSTRRIERGYCAQMASWSVSECELTAEKCAIYWKKCCLMHASVANFLYFLYRVAT